MLLLRNAAFPRRYPGPHGDKCRGAWAGVCYNSPMSQTAQQNTADGSTETDDRAVPRPDVAMYEQSGTGDQPRPNTANDDSLSRQTAPSHYNGENTSRNNAITAPNDEARPVANDGERETRPAMSDHDMGRISVGSEEDVAIDDRPRPGAVEEGIAETKPASGQKSMARDNYAPVPQTPPDSAELVSVEEAVELFRERGLPRHIRTIQKYCARKSGRALKCYSVPTENGIRYMIDKTSIDRFIADATQQAPTGAHPDPEAGLPSRLSEKQSVADTGLEVFEHPYVKRLETQVEKLEAKTDRLQNTVQQVLEQANERLIELQKANAVAQSETLGTFLLEAERIRNKPQLEDPEQPDTLAHKVVHSESGQTAVSDV